MTRPIQIDAQWDDAAHVWIATSRGAAGLVVEARASDGLVEAVSAVPCGAPVIGVQWHPEWDAGSNPASRAFFRMMGAMVSGSAADRA